MTTSTDALVVLGIVADEHNRVLLVRRPGGDRWFFPGGKIEAGEQEADALVREVAEETGVQCEVLRPVGRRIHPETSREISYWLCRFLDGTIRVQDTDEIAEAKWVTIEQAFEFLGTSIFEPARILLRSLA